jgi:hypothetical protein
MSKLIKRKDGSYSKRGLWDNIRKNKGSGKEPTKDMLKQESKIKKEENMNSMYKKGGKTSKPKMKKGMPSFMEESKEMEFGAPGVKPPMKYLTGGEPGKPSLIDQVKGVGNRIKSNTPERPTSRKGYREAITQMKIDMLNTEDINYLNRKDKDSKSDPNVSEAIRLSKVKGENAKKFTRAAAPSDVLEKPKYLKKKGGMVETGMEANARQNRAEGKATMAGKKKMYKTGGAKTMEPGGGGRFAKMVSGLKKEGKSEESAEAIAASAGRKKYGKNRFQSMAAAGKKKMGGKMC